MDKLKKLYAEYSHELHIVGGVLILLILLGMLL